MLRPAPAAPPWRRWRGRLRRPRRRSCVVALRRGEPMVDERPEQPRGEGGVEEDQPVADEDLPLVLEEVQRARISSAWAAVAAAAVVIAMFTGGAATAPPSAAPLSLLHSSGDGSSGAISSSQYFTSSSTCTYGSRARASARGEVGASAVSVGGWEEGEAEADVAAAGGAADLRALRHAARGSLPSRSARGKARAGTHEGGMT